MLDHLGLTVCDFAVSCAFYDSVLATLGFTRLVTLVPGAYPGTNSVAGYGKTRPHFWIGDGRPEHWTPAHSTGSAPVHVAFEAADEAAVRAFYDAAIAAGGKDFGAPGPRPHYHAKYFGAFVKDPDGHNIEAVFHTYVAPY